MMFPKSLVIVASTLVPILAIADTPVPNDHSTVHVLFVVPIEIPARDGVRDSALAATPVAQAIVNDVVLPIDSIHPISIAINGEFVGHAIPGSASVQPIFVLPIGQHKFEFTSDVFKTTKADLRVIGTGSKQYLVVKLLPQTTATNDSQPVDKSTKATSPTKE